MENTPELLALISAALGRIRAGEAPGTVFGRLAAGGNDLRLTAVAVCVACGTSVGEANERLPKYTELFDEMTPGEENIIGEVLEIAGYFDHRVELDRASAEVAETLQEALKAAGPLPSGLAHNVYRSLTTGKLPQAFLSMEALWSRRTPANPQVFWTHMANAARLLGNSPNPDSDRDAVGARRLTRAHDRSARAEADDRKG